AIAHPTPPTAYAATSAAYAVAPTPIPASRPRQPTAVFVAGFWRRLIAAAIDLAIVFPAALGITLVASWIVGVHLPPNLHLLDVDLWIDLMLATDPALVM